MKTFLFILLISYFNIAIAQNVGIGTTTPSEKLDVNGNVNIAGQLKANGNAGTANQMLMKDGSNNLTWGDKSVYKNFIVYDCNNTALSLGTNNCTYSWTVPAGVTKINVECWGGGGGGSRASGGGGGGYVNATFTVTTGTIIPLIVGAGGTFSPSFSSSGIDGGNTTVTVGAPFIVALGGKGGSGEDPGTASIVSPAPGGGFLFSGITNSLIGYYGGNGSVTIFKYIQINATLFGREFYYGNGGDAALLPNSGAKGGFTQNYNGAVYQIKYGDTYGIQNGAGGSADEGGGFYGRGGRVIIRW